MRIVVIGAGVAGLACAVTLAERGCEVALYERSARLGEAAASWFAGGMLAPWCELELLGEAQARRGAWGIDWWLARCPGARRAGSLVVALPGAAADLARFAQRSPRHQRLDHQGVAGLEPDLEERVGDALWYPDEAHLDPRAALASLADRFVYLGGQLHFGQEVRVGDGVAVVDCRGMAARDALPALRGVRGEMLVVRSDEVKLSRPVRVLHPRHPLYVVPRGEGRFMVGATMIESEETRGISLRSALELLGTLRALHPAFEAAEILETGVGLRPAFDDNLPRVERRGATLHVNGLYRHGFLLAPALARQVAAELLGEDDTVEACHADPA